MSFRSLVFNQEVTAKPFYTPFDCSSRYGKFAQFFTGYMRPYARPGSITQKVDAAMDSGAEGFALWSPWVCWVVTGGDHDKYWAMEDKYGLGEYLDELSRAVAVHRDIPVEDAKILLEGCGVEVSLEGDSTAGVGRNGVYEIEFKPEAGGQMVLSVHYRGKAFFTQCIKLE